MFERRVPDSVVKAILGHGEVIEDYPTDKPYPSQLLLGWNGERQVHVVAAYNESEDEAIVITVYEPDAAKWDSAFTRRRI